MEDMQHYYDRYRSYAIESGLDYLNFEEWLVEVEDEDHFNQQPYLMDLNDEEDEYRCCNTD